MNLKMSIRIALARKDKTQAWLADQVGVGPSAISLICSRNSAPTPTLVKIADALGMPVSEFIALGEE